MIKDIERVACLNCGDKKTRVQCHCINPTFCSFDCRQEYNQKKHDWVVKVQFDGKNNFACYNILGVCVGQIVERLSKTFSVGQYDKGKKTVPNMSDEIIITIKKVPKKLKEVRK